MIIAHTELKQTTSRKAMGINNRYNDQLYLNHKLKSLAIDSLYPFRFVQVSFIIILNNLFFKGKLGIPEIHVNYKTYRNVSVATTNQQLSADSS